MKLDRLSKWILSITGVTLVFACFAPLLFTSGSWVDFTNTGQIGDTIGGTMSPIVGIVGALMTFLAFLMQVRANEIQSQQLAKSFELKMVEDQMNLQLASRDALELLSIDMRRMVNNIETTCIELQNFSKQTIERPTGDIPLKFVPKYSAKRYQTIDRNILHNAFVSFMEPESQKADFTNVYQWLDFYSEGFDILKDVIYKPYTDEIIAIKKNLPALQHKLYEAVLNIEGDYGDAFKVLVKRYIEDINNNVIKNGVLDAYALHQILSDGKYGNIYGKVPNEYETLFGQSNLLITTNLMLANEIRNTANVWSKDENIGELKKLLIKIDKALEVYTAEKIQKDFTERANCRI